MLWGVWRDRSMGSTLHTGGLGLFPISHGYWGHWRLLDIAPKANKGVICDPKGKVQWLMLPALQA